MKMKYIIIVLDGASDHPIRSLNGRTPLEVANIPFINSLAQGGILGRVRTVPPSFIPASDVANLSLLGYEPERYYTGRGPLEAANMGIVLGDNDVALRCNLITESDGILRDYSAGHITDEEGKILIEFLNKHITTDKTRIYPGKSYRNIMVYKGGANIKLEKLKYFAPHDIIEKPIKNHLPRGKNSKIIIELMEKSKHLLLEHGINKVRIDLGENPANMIWLWGCGKKPRMESFQDKFGISGAVISAVDLIKGIGRIIGLKVMEVEGATGYYNTNYSGKAQAALQALTDMDFIFVHIESPDEAGHNQDLRMKITCIERIDKMIVGPIIKGLKDKNNKFRIIITSDHSTPIAIRTHTREPVPFLIYGEGIDTGHFSAYSELEAQNSSLYFNRGSDLIRFFLK